MSIFSDENHAAYIDTRRAAWGALARVDPVEGLSVTFNEQRFIGNRERCLEDILGDSRIVIVSGAYFGDEAKGKVTDSIARLEDIVAVARVNSGANAGHTVYVDGVKYVFHILPSAVVNGVKCYIGPNVVADPVSLMDNEIGKLVDKGISYDNLMVGNMFITTPYHKIMDVLGSRTNSSTGVGISGTHASIATKSCPRLDDFFQSEGHQRARFERDMKKHWLGFVVQLGLERARALGMAGVTSALDEYILRLGNEAIVERLEEIRASGAGGQRKVPDHVLEFAKAEDKSAFLIDLYRERVVEDEAFPRRGDVTAELQKDLRAEGARILLESPQSVLLSSAVPQLQDTGTSAQTHAEGVLATSGVNASEEGYVIINVNKFPAPSRVGIGDIPASFTTQDRFSSADISTIDDLCGACTDFDGIQRAYFEAIGENGVLAAVEYTDSTGTYLIDEAMAMASCQQFGEEGATTRKPRITGLYDCVLGSLVNQRQGPHLVLSCMDRGDHCDYVGLTIAYVVHLSEKGDFLEDGDGRYVDSGGRRYRSGEIIRAGHVVPGHNVLKHCYSITKVMDGWKDSPIGSDTGFVAHEGAELPRNVANVIGAIEFYSGFEVVAIGNGVNPEDLIWIDREAA